MDINNSVGAAFILDSAENYFSLIDSVSHSYFDGQECTHNLYSKADAPAPWPGRLADGQYLLIVTPRG